MHKKLLVLLLLLCFTPALQADIWQDFAEYKYGDASDAAKKMDELVQSGVELFFVAEYPWKIPLPENLKFAINAHPTMLPDGRGATPTPRDARTLDRREPAPGGRSPGRVD